MLRVSHDMMPQSWLKMSTRSRSVLKEVTFQFEECHAVARMRKCILNLTIQGQSNLHLSSHAKVIRIWDLIELHFHSHLKYWQEKCVFLFVCFSINDMFLWWIDDMSKVSSPVSLWQLGYRRRNMSFRWGISRSSPNAFSYKVLITDNTCTVNHEDT